MKPKKSLGQHYLVDKNIAGKIVSALEAAPVQKVIEVGPGRGVLTALLLDRKEIDLLAVEIDQANIQLLKQNFPGSEGIFLHADVLDVELGDVSPGQTAVIGNFPYQITSPLFFRILEYRQKVPEVVCMIQKEVAERITAPPGSRTYGILSVLLQAYYHMEYLFTVGPGAFRPRPKVDSAVIRLTRNRVDRLDCDENLFFRVVKTCFNQRRKIIRNSVSPLVGKNTADHELLGKRPEQLNVSAFVDLTRWVQEQLD